MHVWSTNLSGVGTDHLAQQHDDDLTASGGTYTLTLEPGHVYTVTTTTGQGKGTPPHPRSAPGWRCRTATRSPDTPPGRRPEVPVLDAGRLPGRPPCGGGRTGQCVRQMATASPIHWTDETSNQPYTLVGDRGWSNYTVCSDVLLEKSGSAAEIIGRAGTQAHNNNGLNAYHLRLTDTGAWSLLKTDDRAATGRPWQVARSPRPAPAPGTTSR